MKPDHPIRFAFLLQPQFSMMAFAAALEPLRAANRVANRLLYEWPLVSMDGAPVPASNGIEITVDHDLEGVGHPDLLLACVGLDPLAAVQSARLRGWLRSLAGRGCQVGGITGGAFLLAEAGLLDGKRCTVHWEFSDHFTERYPKSEMVADLFVVDNGVFTCSGGTAGLDLMLHFIRQQQGAALAMAVAEQFIHPRIREQDDQQRMALSTRYHVSHPRLSRLLDRMGNSLATPPDLANLAAESGVTTRQVERLFRRHLGVPPAVFHQRLRLDRARHLLRDTNAAIRSIALDCGFGSTSHFCHSYKHRFGHRPSDERRRSPESSDESVANNPEAFKLARLSAHEDPHDDPRDHTDTPAADAGAGTTPGRTRRNRGPGAAG